VIVGYDTRFLSERFALESGQSACACGIHTYLSNRMCPRLLLPSRSSAGRPPAGIIHGSHQSSRVQRAEFSPSWEVPALPETTMTSRRARTPLLEQEQHSQR